MPRLSVNIIAKFLYFTVSHHLFITTYVPERKKTKEQKASHGVMK
jgi:hypothetical protein